MVLYLTEKGWFPISSSSRLVLTVLRLQVTAAKIQQTLPELKRDGNNVLGSLWMSVVYGDKNTSRANSVLSQMEFIPTLAQELQSNPDKVIDTFEQIRKHSKY